MARGRRVRRGAQAAGVRVWAGRAAAVLLLVAAAAWLATSWTGEAEEWRVQWGVEAERGKVWAEVVGAGAVVREEGDVVVRQWPTQSFGSFRGLLFRGSRGIEGGHAVRCRGQGPCTAAWEETEGGVPPLEYHETMALAAVALAGCGPARVLHVGLGAGSLPSFLHRRVPAWHQTVVELSADVLALAPVMGVHEDERLRLLQGEGMQQVGEMCAMGETADVLFLDAYDRLDEVPRNFRTQEAVEALACVLGRQGVLVWNVAVHMRPGASHDNYVLLVDLLRDAFPHLLYLEATFFNHIVLASMRPLPRQAAFLEACEAVVRTCGLPTMTRGRTFLYDLKPDAWTTTWAQHHHKLRLDCLAATPVAACLAL